MFKVNQPKLFQTERATWYEPADYKWHEDEAHSHELYLHSILVLHCFHMQNLRLTPDDAPNSWHRAPQR